MKIARIALSLAAAAAGTIAVITPATATTQPECDGVTVIVDFTDLGGEVEVGCAPGDPTSGRQALELAGFTPVDSQPGLICTINAQPDPCPTEFDGNFWAYWQVADGEWSSASVGADEYDPAPGDVEGWRYNDGAVPPPLPQEVGAAPTDVAVSTTESAAVEDPAATEQATAADAAADDGFNPILGVGIGIVVVGLIVALVLRKKGSGAAS